jgi:hypothetical protein
VTGSPGIIFWDWEGLRGVGLSSQTAIASWIVFYESVITESKAKGCKRQTIRDKLNKAGHLRLYKLYQILCSHSSNQLATLFERHQDNITFYYKRPDETDEPIKACLDLAVGILCDSFGQYLKLTQWTETDIRIMIGHTAKGWRAGDLRSESSANPCHLRGGREGTRLYKICIDATPPLSRFRPDYVGYPLYSGSILTTMRRSASGCPEYLSLRR